MKVTSVLHSLLLSLIVAQVASIEGRGLRRRGRPLMISCKGFDANKLNATDKVIFGNILDESFENVYGVTTSVQPTASAKRWYIAIDDMRGKRCWTICTESDIYFSVNDDDRLANMFLKGLLATGREPFINAKSCSTDMFIPTGGWN
jgi:hypothetical protein